MATANTLETLLNEHDVARVTGLSVASVRRWRLLRQGPKYLKIGAAVRYKPEDISVWLESARAVLSAKVEHPREKLRLVVTGCGWKPIAGKEGAYTLGELDLERSTCKRTLCQDGTLMELVELHGNPDGLNDEELEKWIATFPIIRL